MSRLNLRIVSAAPSIASGGAMTLTRDPSSRRASQIGEASSNSTADLAHDALANVHQLRIVAETDIGQLDLAADFDEASRRAIDHDVGDVVAREQRLERPEAQDVVADVVEQIFLLGDRQHQILDRDDLVHDIANLFPRALGIELRQRGEIDRLDQGAKDEGFGLKICLRSPFGLNGRARRRLRLGRFGDRGGRSDARSGGLAAKARARALAEHRSNSFPRARALRGDGARQRQ